MNPEDAIDWSAIPGNESYCPEDVPKAIAGIRDEDLSAPNILDLVSNNHSGQLHPAAVAATPILIEIALATGNINAATEALEALDSLVWFRGAPPFSTVVFNGEEVALDKAIRQQIKASRPELLALTEREPARRKLVLALLESVDRQEGKESNERR